MTQRQPGPIPFSAIDRCAARYGCAGQDFDDLMALIVAMDEAYLETVAEQARGG